MDSCVGRVSLACLRLLIHGSTLSSSHLNTNTVSWRNNKQEAETWLSTTTAHSPILLPFHPHYILFPIHPHHTSIQQPTLHSSYCCSTSISSSSSSILIPLQNKTHSPKPRSNSVPRNKTTN
ncbi:hypothetical protein E2C01_058970 [Portunus trituberculatus]|uniref:Uncharacterized protein n=1 Tax=Portunus trituberculatus TaxID=210409 RepID=A0A5B7H734_PORTR|nr:hypothetical protein [Portunus trituberculatus]